MTVVALDLGIFPGNFSVLDPGRPQARQLSLDVQYLSSFTTHHRMDIPAAYSLHGWYCGHLYLITIQHRQCFVGDG